MKRMVQKTDPVTGLEYTTYETVYIDCPRLFIFVAGASLAILILSLLWIFG